MEKLYAIAELLGEDNAKRLKDSITDSLISMINDDLENMSDYLIDFEAILYDIRLDIEKELREIMTKKYTEQFQKVLDEFIHDKLN